MSLETKDPETQKPNLGELIKKALGVEDDADEAVVAELIDPNGKLKVDLTLPDSYQLEIMAGLLLDHLGAYHQNRQAWRAARNSGDNARAKQLFEQMNFNQLTAALIQHDTPGVKALADEIAKSKVEDVRRARLARQKQNEE